MLAACYSVSGPEAGRLHVRELPEPSPGPGEVRVRIAVSGVNPTDWKARGSGGIGAFEGDTVVPGQDAAGTIDAVGDGVDRARIGERVWLYNCQWGRAHGSAEQWIALPAERALRLPDSVSFDLGASLGIPAITAHRALFADGALPDGAQLLVHGGAGAVAHAAIELAVWSGARVATTVSSAEKAALAASAGAELVVNYRTEDVAAALHGWAPQGVQRIVEVDPVRNLPLDARVLAPGGAVISYAGATGDAAELPRELMVKNVAVEFMLVYTIPEAAKRAAVEAITRALQDGALTTLPIHRFPLREIAAAHDAVEAGAVGKVLLDIP